MCDKPICSCGRLPKVGEVWTQGTLECHIYHVEEDIVLYVVKPPGGKSFAGMDTKLEKFLLLHHPPKPRPREVWLSRYDNKWYRNGSSSEVPIETLKAEGYRLFREVLDE